MCTDLRRSLPSELFFDFELGISKVVASNFHKHTQHHNAFSHTQKRSPRRQKGSRWAKTEEIKTSDQLSQFKLGRRAGHRYSTIRESLRCTTPNRAIGSDRK